MMIEESEMQFGNYPDDAVFHLEKSPQYQDKLRSNGVKSCEFILFKENALYFIEAKKSCPNQISADTAIEKVEKYHEYIADITNKMRHSLALYANILLKRHDCTGVPPSLLETDLTGKELKLVLVVKNAQPQWLIPLSEKLNRVLNPETGIWKCSRIFVINEATARDMHLVV